MQEDDDGAVLGILEDTEADIDEVEAEPKVVPRDPWELADIPLPRLIEGDRPNLGTRNQELRRPVSWKNNFYCTFSDRKHVD